MFHIGWLSGAAARPDDHGYARMSVADATCDMGGRCRAKAMRNPVACGSIAKLTHRSHLGSINKDRLDATHPGW